MPIKHRDTVYSGKSIFMEKKNISDINSGVPLQGSGVSMFYESSPVIFANAKKLRNEPTPSETIFWNLLKEHFAGIRFKRQHPISQYIADFYCHKLKLVIEIDGSIHETEIAKANDKLRDEFMQSLGLKILRFTNEEVCTNGGRVVKKMKEAMQQINI
ncbi:MAG: endonuclease domain-containing protein [Bacteroidota bacterium]|nr:endonuclease domain-containing protein [Bacteroidota bacterium]